MKGKQSLTKLLVADPLLLDVLLSLSRAVPALQPLAVEALLLFEVGLVLALIGFQQSVNVLLWHLVPLLLAAFAIGTLL